MENCFNDIRYLYSSEFYGSPYVIYNQNDPVGFFDISPIWWRKVCESVELSYALLKEARGKGYMSKALRAVANQILTDNLNDIKEVNLLIHPENDVSKRVALRAGFVGDGLSKEEQYKQGYAFYEKTKVLVLKEINKK